MKKYNDAISNKYFNSSNKGDIIQKRMNNKVNNKYYGDIIQKGTWNEAFKNINRFFSARNASSVGRSVEELNGFARAIDAAKKAAKDAGNSASVNVGKLLEEIIKEHSLAPHETAHVIQSLEGIGSKAKSSYLNEYAAGTPMPASAPTPTPASASASAFSPPPPIARPLNEKIASQIKIEISTTNESVHNIIDRHIKKNNLSYQDLQSILDNLNEEYVPLKLKNNLLNSYTSLPGAPRPKTSTTPVASVPSDEQIQARRKIKNNQLHFDNIMSRRGPYGGIAVSELTPDEIAFLKENLPGIEFNPHSTIGKTQLDRVQRLTGFEVKQPIVAPEPVKRPTETANSNIPYGAHQTVRHEIVVSHQPAANIVHTPEPTPNPFPNSPYSPEQISRYSSTFVAPQQSRRRNFWDRNSALWSSPNQHQQNVNFHANQYEDLLRGNITNSNQRHEVATNLVNRGFIPRDAANKILSDFGDEKRVAPKLSRISSGAKNIYQNNFSTNIPLSPETIARNERNKKLVMRAATAYGVGHYALPIAGAFIAGELSKPKYTGDVNDPNFDFDEYKKTRWIRNIRDLAPSLFTTKKSMQKSASKTKKLRKGPPYGPGNISDVDDAAEAAAAQEIVNNTLTRTENTGRLMQPQEYSATDLANRRTGYGAFDNEGNHSYERIIDEKGNTNWDAAKSNDAKAKMLINAIKTAAKNTAKSKLGLVLPTNSQITRSLAYRTTKNALQPIINGPVGKIVAQKLKNDFHINNGQDLSNASEGVLRNVLSGVIGLASYNPVKEVQHALASEGKQLPPSTFKQIADSVVDQNTQSRINAARKDMLAPFNVPKYVSASTKSRPWTAKEQKQHAEESARYHDLTRQRFEDAKNGTDLSSLNSNSSGMGASRFSGMPSIGLSSRTNENLATNEQNNKILNDHAWKALAWSQGKYKPKNQLEEHELIGALQALPQRYKDTLKRKEKNNLERFLELFNPAPQKQQSYLPLTPSALALPNSPQQVTPTAAPQTTVQQQTKATPKFQQRTNTPYQNPEALKAQVEREIKTKIQQMIQQKRY